MIPSTSRVELAPDGRLRRLDEDQGMMFTVQAT
jgi:hypothetical protein